MLTACSSNYPKQSDAYQVGLIGHVKEIKIITYTADIKFGELVKGKVVRIEDDKYNEGGNFIESSANIKEDTISYNIKLKIQYDKEGRKVSMSEANDPKPTYYFKHNSSGITNEEDSFDKDGKLVSKSKFTLDDNNLVSVIDIYDSEETLNRKFKRKFNDQLRIAEVTEYELPGNLKIKEAFSYNNNFVINHTLTTPHKLEQYTYQYPNVDNRGNWLKRVEFLKNSPHRITERKIVYN